MGFHGFYPTNKMCTFTVTWNDECPLLYICICKCHARNRDDPLAQAIVRPHTRSKPIVFVKKISFPCVSPQSYGESRAQISAVATGRPAVGRPRYRCSRDLPYSAEHYHSLVCWQILIHGGKTFLRNQQVGKVLI